MGEEYKSQIPYFLNSFLSKPASALPKGCLWVLSFDGSYLAGNEKLIQENEVVPITAILKGTEFEPGLWDIKKGLNTLLARDYQQTKGCLFAHNVSIPGENNTVYPEGFQMNGYIRTYIGAGRDAPTPLEISFLETNVSFVDNIIRPWVIATAHLGLIARSGRNNYRCNISVYKLGIHSISSAPYVAGKYTFYGACPVSIQGEDYTYTAPTSPTYRSASFIYHYYTFSTSLNNPAINKNNALNPVPFATKDKNISINVARATSP